MDCKRSKIEKDLEGLVYEWQKERNGGGFDLRMLLNSIEQRIRDDYLGAMKEAHDFLKNGGATGPGLALERLIEVLSDHYDDEAEMDRVHG